MPRTKKVQTNFSSGELDPEMRLRTDATAYENGARRLRNVVLRNTGGANDRPGFWHRTELAGPSRVVRFAFDEDEVYVLCFQHGQVQIWLRGTGLVATLTGARWTSAILFGMTFCSQGDVVMVFHPTMKPHVIRRTSLTGFALEDFKFAQAPTTGAAVTRRVYQPYFKFADDEVTIKPSSDTGTITLTASAPVFQSGHVGTRFRLLDTEVSISVVTSPTLATGVVRGSKFRVDLDPNPLRTEVGKYSVEVLWPRHGFQNGINVTISGANPVGGIPAAEINGIRAIGVLDEDRFYFNVPTTPATSSADGGGPNVTIGVTNVEFRQWTEPVWNDVNGWPACGAFYEDRLWLGGGLELPGALVGSKVGDPFNFHLGKAEDTDAIFVQVGQTTGVSVRHLVGGKHLQIFSADGEYYVPQEEGVPIRPTSIATRLQTPYGTGRVAPWHFDGATLFLQRSGTALREFIYSESERSYNSNSLTVIAAHLLARPKDMAIVYGTEARPEQYAALTNEDGTIAVFHSARVERLAGWVGWSTPGSFLSVTAPDNHLHVCAERGGRWFLEEWADDELTLDGATEFTDAVAKKVWNVGSRYAGLAVDVVTRDQDGLCTYALGTLTVAGDGTLTLPSAETRIVVGFAFAVEIETLPPHIETDKGPLTGEIMRIARVGVGLHSSLTLEVEGTSLVLRQTDDDLSEPLARTSTFHEFALLGHQREPTVTLSRAYPLPMRVLGLACKVSY